MHKPGQLKNLAGGTLARLVSYDTVCKLQNLMGYIRFVNLQVTLVDRFKRGWQRTLFQASFKIV